MSPNAVEGWSAQGAGPGSMGSKGPQYFEGDELGPAALGPAGVGELQGFMSAAGLLDPDDFRFGVWDEASRSAYKSLLGEANASGLSVDMALTNRLNSGDMGGGYGASSGGGEGGEGGGTGGEWVVGDDGVPVFIEEQYVPPPLELRTTNKKDLARVFRAAVIDTMGQGWTQDQINEVVDAYNWQEIRLQKDAYDDMVEMERAAFMGERTEGGEVIAGQLQPGGSINIESPEAFVENQMIEKDPIAYGSGRVVDEMVPAFMQMMGGWTGSGG
jgi:hypothetical protein